jgi:hypothetical protein
MCVIQVACAVSIVVIRVVTLRTTKRNAAAIVMAVDWDRAAGTLFVLTTVVDTALRVPVAVTEAMVVLNKSANSTSTVSAAGRRCGLKTRFFRLGRTMGLVGMGVVARAAPAGYAVKETLQLFLKGEARHGCERRYHTRANLIAFFYAENVGLVCKPARNEAMSRMILNCENWKQK